MVDKLKKGVSLLYSMYVLLVFFLSMPVVLLFYIVISTFPERKRMIWVYKCNIVWINLWGFFTGIRMKVFGNEKLDLAKDYVFLSNHCNMLDIVITGSRIQHPFKPLIKKELTKIPLLGTLFNMTSLAVDRSSHESRQASFQAMVDQLARHISILIFPEGTRNRTNKPLKSFYDGGFRLAIETKTTIVPVVLIGVRELQPVHTFRIYPGTTSLHILDPVPTSGYDMKDLEKLKQLVFDRMFAFVVAHEPMFKDYVAEEKVSSSSE